MPVRGSDGGASAGTFSFARSDSITVIRRCTDEMFDTTATIDSARMIGHSCNASDAECANTAFETGVNADPKIR